MASSSSVDSRPGGLRGAVHVLEANNKYSLLAHRASEHTSYEVFPVSPDGRGSAGSLDMTRYRQQGGGSERYPEVLRLLTFHSRGVKCQSTFDYDAKRAGTGRWSTLNIPA